MGVPHTVTMAGALPRLRMSYAEFLEWSGDTTHAEWVDGEVVVFPSPTLTHQLVVGFLRRVIERLVSLESLGMVIGAPFEMRLPDGSAREPDILFLAREHGDRWTEERLLGPADLAIEVLSESTASYDRGEKFRAYERARVPEFWMVEPRRGRRTLSPWLLGEEGGYQAILPDGAGRFHSRVLPGFWLDPRWFQGMMLPDLDDVMMAIAPDAYFEKVRAAYLARRLSGDGDQGGAE